MEDIDELLNNYEVGKPHYKPDVTKQLAEIKIERENQIKEHIKKQTEYQETMSKLNMIINPQATQQKIDEQTSIIQQLLFENNQLKEQVEYLNNKIKQLINAKLEKLKEQKNIETNNI